MAYIASPKSSTTSETRAARSPVQKRAGGKKVTRRLVVFGSAAVLAVYAVGYAATEPAAEQVAAEQSSRSPAGGAGAAPTTAPVASTSGTSAAASPATPNPSPTETAQPTVAPVPALATSIPAATPVATSSPTTVPPTPTAPASPTPVPSPTAAATGRYRDGSYVGMGYSRHGNIQATVIVKGGKIISADVTRCSTRYPCDLVNPLADQVVAQQIDHVDLISGATDSSDAYAQAVQTALAKAA